MAERQIDHVNVVAYAGAVMGRIIAAKNRKLIQASDRDLRNIGQKVVGNAIRILPIRPLSCAPTGLKYRKRIMFQAGSATCKSPRIYSIMSFERP
jgi:hypothetical protein